MKLRHLRHPGDVITMTTTTPLFACLWILLAAFLSGKESLRNAAVFILLATRVSDISFSEMSIVHAIVNFMWLDIKK